MTTGSSMQAMTLADPPQTRYISTSISPKAPTVGENTLQPSPPGAYFWCAQVIAMDGMYAGFAGAKTGHGRMTLNWHLLLLAIRCFGLVAFSPFCWRHQRSVLAVRRKHAMKACQVDSGLRHQGGQRGKNMLGLILADHVFSNQEA